VRQERDVEARVPLGGRDEADVAHLQLFMDAAQPLRLRWRGDMVMYLYDAASGDGRFRQQLTGCVLDHERFCIER
jgi:hypothetical protein